MSTVSAGELLLAEILSTESVWLREEERLPLAAHVSPEEGALLAKAIALTGATRTLEIGCGYGVSTLYILNALHRAGGGYHTAIDPSQRTTTEFSRTWHGIGLANVERAGYGDRFRLHEGPSHSVLPRLLAAGERYEVVLIDGWHTFDYVLVDFFFSDLLLAPSGIVVFDDTDRQSIREVCRYVLTNRAYEIVGEATGTERPDGSLNGAETDRRLGISADASCLALRKTTSTDDRGWWFHARF